MITKKERKKKDQEIGPRTSSPPPPAIEISRPREIIVSFPHPPLFSHHGYCLEVDVKPSTLLCSGTLASPPWGSCSRSSLTPAHEVRFSPLTPHVLGTSLSILHRWKASRYAHCRCYGVGLSVKVGPGLLGLDLRWGKPRLVTSRSRPGFVVVSKALAMACLSVVASPLAILPLPRS